MLISGLLNNVNVFNDILEGIINIQATAGIFTLSLPFYFISKRSSCLNAYLELIKKIPWKEHCQDWSRVELKHGRKNENRPAKGFSSVRKQEK